MPTIAVVPIVLKDVLLKLGATNEYQKHVSGVELIPSASTVNWKGLTPDSIFTDVTTATWTCNLSFAQDWATTDSLSKYLFANEGTAVVATFQPISGGASFAATLLITPGSIGGQVDSVAVSTVTLGVRGRPVLT
ncbi:hypothetical protein QMG83_14515 [Salinibacterium sp. G-O1]|uniref:hypothetical protein n=1 Tax=Salinibacterium sp. G-O1 TaxID=3046208 RepID=UPI0024BAF605|nr:hypothetical protein [Salinibacterium sp. G-O1]MDJ0336437.1 hypothetical protein [Salinibacterium sp. G-O1]